MLTLEENGWNFKSIKIYSALNIFPVEIDMETGKIRIRRQSSKIRIFLWRLIFCLSITHCLYMFLRLFQSTVVEPEKYFRWDHFVLHVPFALGYALMFYIGFCLFVQNPEECVLIFNQLFVEREHPVQKMMDQENGQKQKLGGKSGFKRGTNFKKSQVWIELEPKPNPNPVSAADEKEESGSNTWEKSGAEFEFGAEHGVGVGVRPLLTWPPKYSLDELLTKILFPMIETTKFFTMIVFTIDANRPQFLYSVLPREYQNVYSFIGLFAVEAIFLTVCFSFWFFSNSCQLLFFGKCQLEFKRLDLQLRNLKTKFQNRLFKSRDIEREIWILRQILKEMRQLVLFIELFNRCFPPCIFAFKLVCFFPILFYFFSIRHFHEFPFLAIFTGYLAIALTLIYGILYQKAFSIPGKMKGFKQDFLLTAHNSTSISTSRPKPKPSSKTGAPSNTNTTCNGDSTSFLQERFRGEINREIRGVQNIGIKVGSFHTLERDTTPKFIDFVLKNVVNLLVTFSR